VTATPEKASGTDDQRVPGRQIEFSKLALDLKAKASDVGSKAAFHLGELTEAGLGSRSFLYEQINAGRLRAHKLGRKTIILKRDLDNWWRVYPCTPRNNWLATQSSDPRRLGLSGCQLRQ